VINLATGRERLLTANLTTTTGGIWAAWSGDGRTVYYAQSDSLQQFTIRAVPAEGGTPRTLVYADAPDQQLHRYGLAVSNGRFFFPLIERKADVWVAEVERK
jgi:hypothetical protein